MLKAFHYLSSLGLSRSSFFPPWITAIPRWGSEGVNFYRQAVTELGNEPEAFEELALLKDSFLLAARHVQELLRVEEAILPEELGDQTAILRALLIAVNKFNTPRLRKLAGFAGFDSKEMDLSNLSSLKQKVEERLYELELQEMANE